MTTTSAQRAQWETDLLSGDATVIASAAKELAEERSRVDSSFRFTVTDKFWTPVGELGGDLISGSGNDPWNATPSARLVIKGDSPMIETFAQCEQTMVGVIVETGGLRLPFYVKKHTEHFEDGAWTHIIELRGIWDVLNYLVIWPSWWLPIQAQPFSHAIYMWGLQTVCESMVAECAIRIQSGIWEFINNALSLNPDIRTWFGALLQSNGNIFDMLKSPIYVKRTNPFLDTSPLVVRTVRMETCGEVITDLTRPFGVETRMDLWLPGDPQPDEWASLDQPTYVFSTVDRSQIEGPTKTVLDSVIRSVVDLTGSFFDGLGSVITQVPGMDGVYESPVLGVNFVPPWAVLIAPEPGEDTSILSCDITHHTQDGWQHIIGGRSPKWLVCAPTGNRWGAG